MAVVRVAYRFALDPTPGQERALRSHAGAARFAWNWGLHQCRQRYAAERKWCSATELHRLWNAAVRPGPAGHAALKREPGTPPGDKTGTAASKAAAA